jgi:hypothetical protein
MQAIKKNIIRNITCTVTENLVEPQGLAALRRRFFKATHQGI